MTKTAKVKRYHFIINPKSGSSVDIWAVRRIRDTLRRRGFTVRLDLTQSLEDAGRLAAEARAENVAAVIVVGGDGTVRHVAGAMAGSQIPIMIIPAGTENLLACELQLDGSFGSTLQTLDYGRIRNLDLGQANGRHFMAILGVGFDGQVIRRVNRLRAGHITHMDYIWPICRTYWEYHFAHMTVEADGELLCDEPALVFVGNISRYAVGLGVLPNADCGDGLLDVCIYKCHSRGRLLLHALLTVLGMSHYSSLVIRRKCRSIAISSPVGDVPVQLDGDPGPELPLKVEVMPAAARVLVPPAPQDGDYRRSGRFYYLRKWLRR